MSSSEPPGPEPRAPESTGAVMEQPSPDAAATHETSKAEPLTRRALRTGAVERVTSPAGAETGTTGSARALAWLDDDTVRADGGLRAVAFPAGTAYEVTPPPLVREWPRRAAFRPGMLIGPGIAAAVAAVYVVAMLVWPLYAVAPRIAESVVDPAPPAVAALPWPGEGSAAVAVAGVGSPLASAGESVPMASISKLVAVLVVLESMPLEPGEQGPEFAFTFSDRSDYWSYLSADESALDVPVGGTLTQYQLIEGALIGSAGNYVDRLVSEVFPTDDVYAAAATEWLQARGVQGITIVDPTGIDPGNTASPTAVVALGERALAHPVVAEIVAKPAVELPGAGFIENTNGLIGDPGIVGIKTGSLFGDFNLLSAKDVTVGDTSVRIFASVLGQPDNDTRLAVSRALYDEVERELQPTTAVAAGTRVGGVTTLWGVQADVVTDEDATVVLWNDARASADAELELGDSREAGERVGTMTVSGPAGASTVTVSLASDIEGPDGWWRITHPLQLLGLAR